MIVRIDRLVPARPAHAADGAVQAPARERVIASAKFYATLAQDIRAGPGGPRTCNTALHQDLADLRR